jgi:hypothetical protein
MARPERFELPTFWFVGKNIFQSHTTAVNYAQANSAQTLIAIGPFWPLSAYLHGQKTDSRLSPVKDWLRDGLLSPTTTVV